MSLLKSILYKFSENIIRVFSGYNLLWHFLAWVLTYALAVSGFDWWYFQATRSSLLQSFLFPAVMIGAFVPLIGIPAFIAVGIFEKKIRALNTAYALAQAALLGLLVSDFYKALTGRAGTPGLYTHGAVTDTSRVFWFGFLRDGVFFGWPSSHTTIAFSMALAVWQLYPKSRLIRYAAVFYAFYIGIGVSTNIHWFSDFVAGAIIGTLIGTAVGRSFRKRYEEKINRTATA